MPPEQRNQRGLKVLVTVLSVMVAVAIISRAVPALWGTLLRVGPAASHGIAGFLRSPLLLVGAAGVGILTWVLVKHRRRP